MTPGLEGICSKMLVFGCAVIFIIFQETGMPPFDVAQRSRHSRFLENLKIILLVRDLHIFEHMPSSPGWLWKATTKIGASNFGMFAIDVDFYD